jgi:hypothetical protein
MKFNEMQKYFANEKSTITFATAKSNFGETTKKFGV